MRKIIGIGETILDIIFKDNKPTSGTPGGSVFNGMVSLGRLGLPVCFISDIGQDKVGALIADFMETNGMSTDCLNRHPSAKTAVSLAFLNEQNDAEYTFFKDYSYEGLQGDFPSIQADDIVVFGSYYALNPLLRKRMKVFLQAARDAGAILYYDINFRASYAYEAESLEPVLIENVDYADILRGSEEDFMALFQAKQPDWIYQNKLAAHCSNFIFTAAEKGVELRTKSLKKHYDVTEIQPLSTIGAGDTFNAGIVFGLMKHHIRREMLAGMPEAEWDRLIDYAIRFSSQVCMSYDNYISKAFASTILKENDQAFRRLNL